MIYVVMGVSGSGKSSVGAAVANLINADFYDADDFHSAANKAKMTRGLPLTDDDRLPWLTTLHTNMLAWQQQGRDAVLACSALKNSYRDLLRYGCSTSPSPVALQFIYLKISIAAAAARLESRAGHFFAKELLTSQFETLEEPQDALIHEYDGASVIEISQQIKEAIASRMPDNSVH